LSLEKRDGEFNEIHKGDVRLIVGPDFDTFFVMLFKRLIFNYIQNLINFLGGATK